MNTFPVAVEVTLTIPLVDLVGDPVTATGLHVELFNQDGEFVTVLATPDFEPGDTEVEVVIPAQHHATPGGREVQLEITTASMLIPAVHYYVIEELAKLAFLTNTFQTYPSAVFTASRMLNMTGWDAADDNTRQRGLIAAYEKLTRIAYRIVKPSDVLDQSYLSEDYADIITPRSWSVMTLDRWNALPAPFKEAIKKAQVAEAAELLSDNNGPSDRRRLGLLSETIGESSQMFRSGKPLDMGMSSRSLEFLGQYIDNRVVLTRA